MIQHEYFLNHQEQTFSQKLGINKQREKFGEVSKSLEL